MLSSSDEKIQSLSFKCLVNLNPHSAFATHRGDVEKLISHKSLRRQLTLFKIDTISKKDQVELSNVLIPILFGQMTSKKGKTDIQAKRRAIFGFCVQLENGFVKLLEHVFKPFHSLLQLLKERSNSMEDKMELSLPEISVKKQDGFLNTIGDIIVYFELQINSDLLNDFLYLIIHFLEQSFLSTSKSFHGDVRKISQLRLAEVFDRFPAHDYQLFWKQIISFLKRIDDKFASHFQDASSYFNCLLTISKHHTLAPLLLESNVIQKTLNLLSNSSTWNPSSLINIFHFLDNLLLLQSGDENKTEEPQPPLIKIFSEDDVLTLLKQCQNLITSGTFSR